MDASGLDRRGSERVDSLTSATLLEGLRDAGNAPAWQRFNDRYRPLVLAFARKLGLDDNDAQDAAQETMMAFVTGYRSGGYDPVKGRLRSWLFGVAHRKCMDIYRRGGREMVLADRTGATAFVGGIEGPDQARAVWEAQWQRAVLDAGLAEVASQVNEQTMEAFRLTVFDQCPAEEVAAKLGLTENAVYAAKHRVMTRLRKALADLEEEW